MGGFDAGTEDHDWEVGVEEREWDGREGWDVMESRYGGGVSVFV